MDRKNIYNGTLSSNRDQMKDLYEAHQQYTRVTEEQWRSELQYESLKNNGVGNIFIKNLEEQIDEKVLAVHFSPFGEIVKSKVARESNGKSKGYGYVNYNTDEAANAAIKYMNGMCLNGKKLIVKHFVRYKERHPNQPETKKNTASGSNS